MYQTWGAAVRGLLLWCVLGLAVWVLVVLACWKIVDLVRGAV